MTDIDGSARLPQDLPAELADWPAWTLDDAQLGDLELITSGAFAPLDGYLGAADLAAVAARATLADGTPWPVRVELDVPAGAAPAGAGHLVLQDQEGSPLAVLAIAGRIPAGEITLLAGPVTALRAPEHGPFRALRRLPADVRAELADDIAAAAPGRAPAAILAYATRRPLSRRHIGQLRHHADLLNARLLLLPLVTGPADVVSRPDALVRTVLAASAYLPASTLVIPVPLARRAEGPDADLRASAIVAAAYGATHLLAPDMPDAGRTGTLSLPGVPIPVIREAEWAYDPLPEVWRPLSLIEPGAEQGELSDDELGALLDSGDSVPAWFAPDDVVAELRRARPPRRERGLVVFFTGLSGSGKSTIARGLAAALGERGDRTVSLLDGDHVRQLLSAGLTFSRTDRDRNIARIGYVAAEIARHGGIAICAPIAPYAAARAVARDMAQQTGDFLLVYVATPVEVCAARDRKGLYAKARAGLLDGFTGVSDPYEEPYDADLVLDTSAMKTADAVNAVLRLLITGGWLTGKPGQPDNGAAPRTASRPGPAVRRL
ncbi:MAG TPA: adenylyl-sulfate kinase [Streptosporangiaceae bacterium]|nr:adenylyl-sulfate kinase [Streptosporangiaceae bacterium]